MTQSIYNDGEQEEPLMMTRETYQKGYFSFSVYHVLVLIGIKKDCREVDILAWLDQYSSTRRRVSNQTWVHWQEMDCWDIFELLGFDEDRKHLHDLDSSISHRSICCQEHPEWRNFSLLKNAVESTFK